VVTVATGGLHVMAAANVNQDDNQQGYDDDSDSGHFHPAWCAGVGKWIGHVRRLFCRAVVKMDAKCETRQHVQNRVNEQHDANVRYGTICSICPGIVWRCQRSR
jgi:hypothetical protein